MKENRPQKSNYSAVGTILLQPTGQCCFAIASAFSTCPSLRFGHVNTGRTVVQNKPGKNEL
jgi:hypothetical protein